MSTVTATNTKLTTKPPTAAEMARITEMVSKLSVKVDPEELKAIVTAVAVAVKCDSREKRAMTCSECGEVGHTKAGCQLKLADAKCTKCGLVGVHFSKNCDKPKVRKCSNCEEIGHTVLHCPHEVTEKVPSKTYFCSLCKAEGHNSRKCPTKSETESDLENKNKCKICGELGHNSRRHKNDKFIVTEPAEDSESESDSESKKYKCGKCGELGHNKKTCSKLDE